MTMTMTTSYTYKGPAVRILTGTTATDLETALNGFLVSLAKGTPIQSIEHQYNSGSNFTAVVFYTII